MSNYWVVQALNRSLLVLTVNGNLDQLMHELFPAGEIEAHLKMHRETVESIWWFIINQTDTPGKFAGVIRKENFQRNIHWPWERDCSKDTAKLLLLPKCELPSLCDSVLDFNAEMTISIVTSRLAAAGAVFKQGGLVQEGRNCISCQLSLLLYGKECGKISS